MLNYFTTIADGENDARGANSASEFTRQRDKIINAIVKIDADVVGLMEIENNGYGADSAIQDLVNGLNAVAGAGTYDLLDPGVPKIGTDAIAVGFLYKPASVTPIGGAAILDSSVDPQFDDTKNRPALAQTFMEKASGNLFTPVVNHLKSKGSSCGDGDDDTTTDGQGNCNLTRTNAATALANWLATDPTGSGDPDFLIIGDLNSYAKEDPIVVLQGAGYTDLATSFEGMYAYSYVFSGEVGYLDYAMASTSILAQVTGTTIWDINSDEPRVIDYNDDILDPGESYINPGAYLYGPHANRASDHDPVIVGLMLVQKELEGSITQTPSADPLVYGDTVAVDVNLFNATSDDIADGSAIVWLDDEVTYVDGSANNATPLSAMQAADLLARMGQEAPTAVDDSHGGDEVVGILWNGMLASGETTDFGFVGMVSSTTGSVMHAVNVFDGYMPIGTFVSDSLDITETAMVELPLLADTWVNSDGSSSALNYNDYAALVARTTGVDNILLTFDRSALPEGANIISADLMVNVTLESGAFGKELTVLNTEGFDSATVTFETAPDVYNPGEPVAAAVGMLSFDVANNVAAWDAAGAQATDDHHMDWLAISASGPFGRISMDSMESYQAEAPTLTVVYFVE